MRAVDVVALLKVNVLEEVAANRPRGNGVAIHIDARQLRVRAFDRHQSLAKRRYSSIVGPNDD